MPSRTLPTILLSDLATRNTKESCYVTVGQNVYDMTDFIESHPGGGDLILEYGGKDVTEILKDMASHEHSEAAYEILEESHIGFVVKEKLMDVVTKSSYPNEIIPLPATEEGIEELNANGIKTATANEVYTATGMSSAADLEVETDPTDDYKKHKFIDLNKPMLMQVWFGGFEKDFYLEQIHRPRHYKGGESAPLFGNFLEPLSKTPWWLIPIIWLPPVTYGCAVAAIGLNSVSQAAAYWLLGLSLWTLVEYTLHRCVFHLDEYLPNNRVALTAHFLLHGVHHYLPMDKLRLVMPPTLFLALAIPFYHLAHFVFYWNWNIATAVFCGSVFGYICYDLTHYFLHHRNLPSYYRELKKYHLQHHYMDYQNGFGVTSRFWDDVFGTALAPPPSKVVKSG